jgi:hypothetical protein
MAAMAGDPINRARITMVGVDALGALTQTIVAGPTVTDLDPASDNWHLDFEYSQPDGFSSVAVLLELIHAEGAVEATQWSGFSQPIRIGNAESGAPLRVDVYRGSPRDLEVRSIRIANVPQHFDEGDSASLTVQATGVADPTVFWSSSDTAVASVNTTGGVYARRDGKVFITATAGAVRDSVLFAPAARAATLQITGSGFADLANGESVHAGAVIRDARGAVVTDQVVWESTNPSVLAALGSGLFKGVATGSASIRATAASRASVSSLQTVAVTSRPAANLQVSWVGLATPDSAIVGTPVRITVIGASNGAADAPAVHARLLILDAVTHVVAFDSTFAQPAIPAGTPIVSSAPFTFAATRTWPATAILQVITDVSGELVETNESDNSAQSPVFRIVRH